MILFFLQLHRGLCQSFYIIVQSLAISWCNSNYYFEDCPSTLFSRNTAAFIFNDQKIYF